MLLHLPHDPCQLGAELLCDLLSLRYPCLQGDLETCIARCLNKSLLDAQWTRQSNAGTVLLMQVVKTVWFLPCSMKRTQVLFGKLNGNDGSRCLRRSEQCGSPAAAASIEVSSLPWPTRARTEKSAPAHLISSSNPVLNLPQISAAKKRAGVCRRNFTEGTWWGKQELEASDTCVQILALLLMGSVILTSYLLSPCLSFLRLNWREMYLVPRVEERIKTANVHEVPDTGWILDRDLFYSLSSQVFSVHLSPYLIHRFLPRES